MAMRLQDLDWDQTYTYADYLGWKFEEAVELIRGRLFRMSPAPNIFHQEISANLLSKLLYFFGNKSCKVFHAPFDVRLPLPPGALVAHQIDTVVQPDICVICDLGKLDLHGCQGPPDWIIEIVSPTSAKKDTREKFDVYEFSGVKEYWIVYPEAQNVYVYTLNEEGKYTGNRPFAKDDQISPSLFPHLLIDLGQIFPDISRLEEQYVEYLRL